MVNVGADEEGYFPAVPAVDVRVGEITLVEINGLPVILTRLGEAVHAFSAFCPHASADLSQGSFYKGRIDCPDHGYRFDIQSGRAVWPEDEVCRLKKYPVKEENGRVMVKL
jgi:nitrite reductase/ring-hydroxylating ferredoxin subunit